ncbi:hypothetical protein LZ31DRAFT_55476 [Colletotrichum somersetense]|nr:hypothetical protein LZ31DRAFT_55476 [Colletotrichum somersetense]
MNWPTLQMGMTALFAAERSVFAIPMPYVHRQLHSKDVGGVKVLPNGNAKERGTCTLGGMRSVHWQHGRVRADVDQHSWHLISYLPIRGSHMPRTDKPFFSCSRSAASTAFRVAEHETLSRSWSIGD